MLTNFIHFFLFLTILLIFLHSIKISRKNFFEPVYFVLLGYILLFFIQFLKLKENIIPLVGFTTINYGLLLATLSLIVFYLGYRSKFSQRIALSFNFNHFNEIKHEKLLPIGFFLIIIGLIGYIGFIKAAGGFYAFFSVARGASVSSSEVSSYVMGAKWLLFPGLILLIIEALRLKGRIILKLLIYSLAISYLLFQIYIGQRAGVVSVSLLYLALFYLYKDRYRKMKIFKLFFIGLLIGLVIGFISKFREEIYIGSEFSGIKTFINKSIDEQIIDLINSTGEGKDQWSDTWRRNEVTMYFRYIDVLGYHVDYDYGEYFLNYAIWWIPRTIWPDRPDLRNEKKIEFENEIGTSHLSGPSITMLAFNYMHFGLLSLLLLMYIYGIILGYLEKVRRLNNKNYFVLLIFLVFFQTGWMDMLGSGFFQMFHFWAPFKLMPIIIVYMYLKFIVKKG